MEIMDKFTQLREMQTMTLLEQNWLLYDSDIHRDFSPLVTEVRQNILLWQSSATPMHTKIVSLLAVMHHFSTLQRKATYTSPRDLPSTKEFWWD